MASDSLNQGLASGVNPVDAAMDVRSVQGTSYIATSRIGDNEFTSGMLVRYVEIVEESGLLMKANITISDLAFLVSSLARMLHEDIETLKSISNIKILLDNKDFDRFVGYLGSARDLLAEAEAAAKLLPHWTPVDEPDSD